ncbi:hypothetical protein [Undibacterium terreum]|uniref:Uncharacterized protein n=1 Tax=Undibacterium terreum TaxID=1224302 RepID=A0A916XAX9_9BURK|nr:hypothetical protein [Undibacterium terreum]GGC58239.1 hypothetical protein GCM10011396_01360 [Undibacterium terreum]
MSYINFKAVTTLESTHDIFVNAENIKYIEVSHRRQIGKSLIHMIGTTDMIAVDTEFQEIPGILPILTRENLPNVSGGPDYEGSIVYVNPVHANTVTPIKEMYVVRFNDGSELMLRSRPAFLARQPQSKVASVEYS